MLKNHLRMPEKHLRLQGFFNSLLTFKRFDLGKAPFDVGLLGVFFTNVLVSRIDVRLSIPSEFRICRVNHATLLLARDDLLANLIRVPIGQ